MVSTIIIVLVITGIRLKNVTALVGIIWGTPIAWAVILFLLDIWLGIKSFKSFKGTEELFTKVFRKGEWARREEARENHKRRIQDAKDRKKQMR